MITDLLERHAAERGDRAFVVTNEGSHSFSEVHTASRRFCRRLREAGVTPGAHVGLIAANSAAYLTCWFGISMAGAVAVTLSDQLVGDGLRYALEQSDATLLVADAKWLDARGGQLTGGAAELPQISLGPDRAFFDEMTRWAEADPARLPASNSCTILYTSGSTGLPKGVVNSHRAYEAAGHQTAETVGLTVSDRILVVLPLFHANPQMFAVMSALHTGASLAILPRFSAGDFFLDARRLGATCFTFVGTVLSILVARHPEPHKDHGIRFCIGGGTPPEVWRAIDDRFAIRVYEAYGMTEVGCFVTGNSLQAYRQDTCGRPRSDMDVRILDGNDAEVPPGIAGEIVVRPREPFVIMSGYYKKPEITLESYRNLWFHTVDRGSMDADGFLHFRGRLKELIRRSGEMISPVEVETKLRDMPAVIDCAIVGVSDQIVGEEIKAVVVVSPGTEPSAIRDFLTGRIPTFMLPRYVEFASEIPKTETQKILRYKLQGLGPEVHDLTRKA